MSTAQAPKREKKCSMGGPPTLDECQCLIWIHADDVEYKAEPIPAGRPLRIPSKNGAMIVRSVWTVV